MYERVSGFGAYRWSGWGVTVGVVAALWMGQSDFEAMAQRMVGGGHSPAGPVVPQPPPVPEEAAESPSARDAFFRSGMFVVAEENPFVTASLKRLGQTAPRVLDAYLSRAEAWRTELTPILEANDVPAEFLYLALVESGMDPTAISSAEAVGLWQFRAETARQYGLSVGDEVDERTNERRATHAASRYLRDLYEQFGTWELAAAAYNAGPGRVQRALDRTGAGGYWELVEAGELPRETRAYVPKFLAVVQLAAERENPPARLTMGMVAVGD